MKRFVLILALAGAAVFPIVAQQAPSKTRATVEALASERFEGRLAGSNGERLAGEYLASQLRRIGAKPLPGHADYFLPFEFTAGTRDGGSSVTVGSHGKSSDGSDAITRPGVLVPWRRRWRGRLRIARVFRGRLVRAK